jgi:hypothetical protein
MCEAHNAPTPSLLPMPVTAAIPDLHWLWHTAPARLVGHPEVLDRPATVTLAPCPAAGDLATGVPALEEWLATDRAAFAVARLAARSADERHLYLTVDYTGLAPDAFDALAHADGVPAAVVAPPAGHLAPVVGAGVRPSGVPVVLAGGLQPARTVRRLAPSGWWWPAGADPQWQGPAAALRRFGSRPASVPAQVCELRP